MLDVAVPLECTIDFPLETLYKVRVYRDQKHGLHQHVQNNTSKKVAYVHLSGIEILNRIFWSLAGLIDVDFRR